MGFGPQAEGRGFACYGVGGGPGAEAAGYDNYHDGDGGVPVVVSTGVMNVVWVGGLPDGDD